MKRKILGYLVFALSVLLVGCQGEELNQETPNEVVENFAHTLYDVDYEAWAPQFTEYLDSLNNFYETIKTLITEERNDEIDSLSQEQLQSVQELYGNLTEYISLSAFEDAVLTKNSFSEPRQTCFDYQANSRVISIAYDETVYDEQSVGYLMTINYEISLLHENIKKELKQDLNIMIKQQEDNSWKITELIMGENEPILIDEK